MVTPFAVPEKIRHAQEQASDPRASAWVAANAGSGKTTVLVRRVIRLMMAGVPPARILCLTYTKAAAAHMANEVLRTLSAWVRLDDAALDARLAEVDPAPISAARRARARRLFTAALETPGGLKVQTIHAFCDRVLHQFPFEAGVPAGFEVLDEVTERDLLARARLLVLLDAAQNRDAPLGQALAHAVAVASDQSLATALDEAAAERRRLAAFHVHFGAECDLAVAAALGLEAHHSIAMVERAILDEALLPRSEWRSIAETLMPLGGNATKNGERLAKAAAAAADAAAIDWYLSIFLSDKGELRDDGGLGNAKARKREPALFARLLAERDRVGKLMPLRRAARVRERTAALLALAAATNARYEQMKGARGALDLGDLVSKTVDLLTDQAAAWVHYKLDGGIDHILLDEAQDTSPEQWRVIEQLANEFFAGRGAAEHRQRTIFAVGDEKQSIFSFQGADPVHFENMRERFRASTEQARHKFHPIELQLSFRSAPVVLRAIDCVFARPIAHDGLTGEPKGTMHEAIRREAPALVEIWPFEPAPADGDDGLAWDAPLDARAASDPTVVLAQRIARAIKYWTGGGLTVTDRESRSMRGARPGDVIVLVRQRGPLFEAILRALKTANIPVAGADRLKLVDHIAVMDFLALADALLLERDDLALACALKSPLFGLSEDDLFRLAHGRAGTLADSLAEKARTDPRFAEAAARLARWRTEARSLRPFDFLSRVLGRDGGRMRMLARLGPEAADAIDELLTRALIYEQTETPSLVGFAAFVRRAGAEVKRDLEIESAAVRVMTVHGVKGLEAPIVVLADTTAPAEDGRFDPKIMAAPVPNSLPGSPEVPLWALAKEHDSAALAEARERARKARAAEYRRLLYVALTRAADALVVCGCSGRAKDEADLPDDCWYRLVLDALKEGATEQAAPYAERVWRWRSEPVSVATGEAAIEARPAATPAWLRQAIAGQRGRLRLTPSLPLRIAARTRAASAALDPLRRGEIIHTLLQLLAARAPADRESAAARLLDAAAGDLAEADRLALASEAMAVVNHADCAVLFGENSRAEVPLLARLETEAGPIEVSGRIDRLAEAGKALHIADFKTDGTVPARAEDAPEHYVLQLALYRAALARLDPRKPVHAHLVWTAKPQVQEIPAALLDAALERALQRVADERVS
jgi:ATP-dependent helicase/nuclease subunit A